jgi:ABC-type uncharacterized transport system substrate-binding protein
MGDVEQMGKYARELVALQPDAIFAGSPAVPGLQQATRTIPIVFVGGPIRSPKASLQA